MEIDSDAVEATVPEILNNDFPDHDSGLTPPRRRTTATTAGPAPVARRGDNALQTAGPLLQIVSLDRADPPGYRAGGVPRAPQFNRNVLAITSAPRMPEIAVRCAIRGFSPQQSPIHWRLQCRYVLARHMNNGDGEYAGASEIHQDEWQGRSTAADFTLFAAQRNPAVSYDYNDDRAVMGGHAILTIMARLPGNGGWLTDYVHLRIVGTNPVRANVEQYVEQLLDGRDSNVLAMLRAIFVHESDYTQFKVDVQTRNRAYGRWFDWPDDPARFPLATFDFGVGISQWTKLPGQRVSRAIAWDWRENVRAGTNLFLTVKLRGSHRSGRTWREWARIAWRRYNGSGERAQRYAANLAASTEGLRVSGRPVPPSIDVRALTAHIPGPAPLGPPPAWPPQAPPRR